MNKLYIHAIAALALCCSACSSDDGKPEDPGPDPTPGPAPEHNYPAPLPIAEEWKSYYPGDVDFKIESPRTTGAQIYKKIVPQPEKYIQENALRVLQTLYYSPEDENIPKIKTIKYILGKCI